VGYMGWVAEGGQLHGRAEWLVRNVDERKVGSKTAWSLDNACHP